MTDDGGLWTPDYDSRAAEHVLGNELGRVVRQRAAAPPPPDPRALEQMVRDFKVNTHRMADPAKVDAERRARRKRERAARRKARRR